MKLIRIKFFVGILAILLLLGFGYRYREDVSRLLQELLNQSQPCQKPITYSIGNIDSRFGLSETEVLNDIEQTKKVWESSINKQLFKYSPTGDLKINFIYDYRQETTDELSKMGTAVNNDQSTYGLLKTKYDTLVASYNKGKARLDTLIATYNADKSAYEKKVSSWNSKGGAPEAERNALEQKRAGLNNQVATINQVQDSLNGMVDTINSTRVALNESVTTLNSQVKTYNKTGSSADKEFGGGEYVRDASGTAINIFQFNNPDQLETLLTHELGHALGLKHIDNPQAIMYYVSNNDGMNKELTADDLVALKNICGIK